MQERLTHKDLLKLICDIAYEQAIREISGSNWLSEFYEKIHKMEHKKCKRD